MSPIDSRPTVVIYGNCQADAATTVFNKHPGFAERYRAIYYPGYDHPTQNAADIPSEDLARCVLLLEQRDQLGFAGRDRLPREIKVVKFPAVDFNLYWPFSCTNPFASVPGVESFPYGDRIILGCVRKGMAADEILEYYLTGWPQYHTDLYRLAALENARIALRDSHSDLKFGSLVLEQFRDRRILWTTNHPTVPLLSVMMERLLSAAFPGERWVETTKMEKFITDFFSWRGPLGKVGIPVHPEVAASLGLTWYDSDEKYLLEGGDLVSYPEYFERLIRASLDGHASSSVTSLP
ncbi:MAG: WcbI family polysaccharide biosynthesis putative acetyltransferase [Candidatus Eremiobacteraeota bacterium]|nr:WcbI family polysaccharide biosynthesis putative acetyltransferase [Candidatus Eremiobacteraeota bacterium]